MILVKDGTVLTFNQEEPMISKGGVLIEGEEIVAVGKGEDLQIEYPEAIIIRAKDGLIMPGLINTHMHLYSTFARGMDLKTTPPQDFLEVLEKLWWRLDGSLTKEDLYYSAIYAILEGIENGTTTLFDHHASYGFLDHSLTVLKEVVKKTGIRASLCFEVSNRHGQRKGLAALEENRRFIEGLSPTEKHYLQGMMGIHASFTLEDATLTHIQEVVESLQVPCHVHVAEGIVDVEDSKKRGYQGVVHRLNHFNILQAGTLAVHGVHLTGEEYRELALRKCFLIHNPQSNMGNGVGTAHLEGAQGGGLSIGLGTDGYSTDMFQALKVAHILTSHRRGVPGSGADLSYKMLFDTNLQVASGAFHIPLGRLAAGYGADLIIVDYSPPTPLTNSNLFYHLLMGVCGAKVRTTIARGKVLMEDRELKIMDGEQIKERCRMAATKFWERF